MHHKSLYICMYGLVFFFSFIDKRVDFIFHFSISHGIDFSFIDIASTWFVDYRYRVDLICRLSISYWTRLSFDVHHKIIVCMRSLVFLVPSQPLWLWYDTHAAVFARPFTCLLGLWLLRPLGSSLTCTLLTLILFRSQDYVGHGGVHRCAASEDTIRMGTGKVWCLPACLSACLFRSISFNPTAFCCRQKHPTLIPSNFPSKTWG